MFRIIALIMPLAISFAIALDLYIPEVPRMVKIFETTESMVQLTLSVFMVVCGVGQLFVGPLSDEFGRRRSALFSIVIFIIGGIGCILSPTIRWLIMARAVQAFGACGMMVTSFAVVRDSFSGRESGQAYSYVSGAIGLSPLLAPIIGGYLILWFGWTAPFYTLVLFGVGTFILLGLALPETHPPEKRVKINKELFKRYMLILRHPQFIAYCTPTIAAQSSFFTFFSVSPYLVINLLGVPMEKFGFYFGYVGLLFFISCFISAWIVKHIGVFVGALVGSSLILLCAILMFFWNIDGKLTVWSLMVPMTFFGPGAALCFGAGSSGTLEPFGELAGTAAALMGALQFVTSAFIGALTISKDIESAIPLSISMLIPAMLAVISILTLSHRSRPKSPSD